MNPRLILPFALLAAGAGARAGLAAEASAPRLNVVLLMAEDLDTTGGCAGSADLRTPQLERLCQRGRVFERAYAQYPAPGPSRVSLLYGRRPEHTRVWAELTEPIADARPLQDVFRAAGYFTARLGRLYGGAAEARLAWDLAEDAPPPPAAAGATARRAAGILEEHRAGPFFLAMGLAAPAAVETPSADATAPTAAAPAELPTIALRDLDAVSRPGTLHRPAPLADDQRRQMWAARRARRAALEAELAVLLDTLERLALWPTTVIVVAGTNGGPSPDRGVLLRADGLFEESLRTPLVIAAPGLLRPGASTRQVVELLDVHPTLLQLCGLSRPGDLEGTSLLPLLSDPDHPVKSAARSVVRRDAARIGRSVRTDRWRFNEWPDGSVELYDHQTDGGEYRNLAHDPAHAPTVEQLEKRLEAPTPGPSAVAGKGRRRLNVLLILLDDLNVHVGAYGHDVKTPNIDRLARMGRRFDRAYAQVAVCSPSRTSLLSGWRPERTRIWNNVERPRERLQGAVPLQEHFDANGYFTAYVGKVWETAFARDFKWDLGMHDAATATEGPSREGRRARRSDRQGIASWWTATDARDEDEPDGQRARRVAALLEEHRQGPFFIAAGFAKPHLRWVAPRKYFDLYPPESIRFPPDPPDDGDDIPAIALANSPVARPGLRLTGMAPEFNDDERRQATAAYHAVVSFADAQVGVLLDALDRLHLWDDTVVVLLGDHGHHLGEHRGLWRKDTLFEEALRAPLIVVAPGVASPGEATRALVEFVDLYPTLLELTGLPPVKGLDGLSLAPILRDPQATVKDAAYSVRAALPPLLGVSVRTDRYRYTQWPDGSEELFDHQNDPAERANVAGRPEHAAALAESRRLAALP